MRANAARASEDSQRVGEHPAVGRQVVEHGRVLRGVGDDAHAPMVLRGAADHRRAADVDLLDRGLERDVGAAHGRLERIEVHDHEVDGDDAVLGHGGGVTLVVAQAEQRAVDARDGAS